MKKVIFFALLIILIFSFDSSISLANELPDDIEIPENDIYELPVKAMALGTSTSTSQWHLSVIDNQRDFSSASRNPVTVAVLDTGVNRINDLSCNNFVNGSTPLGNMDQTPQEIIMVTVLTALNIAGCDESKGRGVSS